MAQEASISQEIYVARKDCGIHDRANDSMRREQAHGLRCVKLRQASHAVRAIE
jgi:hypothetical protein